MTGTSRNFSFLTRHSPDLARLGTLAEHYFHDDAPAALIKLRQLAEFLAKEVAARHALLPSAEANFDDTLRALKLRAVMPREVADLFYHLKKVGNAAAHENAGTPGDVLTALKMARTAADVSLVQSILDQAKSLLTTENVKTATDIAKWIGLLGGGLAGGAKGLFELLKFLRKVRENEGTLHIQSDGTGNVIVSGNGNTINVRRCSPSAPMVFPVSTNGTDLRL